MDLQKSEYVYFNAAQVEITGFTAEELNGLSSVEALERVHPDDRLISLEHQRALLQGHGSSDNAEYRWKVKSGEYRWFSDSRKLVRDAQGQPTAMVGITRDITEHKKQEDKLKQQQARLDAEHARLRTLVEALPVGVIMIDASGSVLLKNNVAVRILSGGLSSLPDDGFDFLKAMGQRMEPPLGEDACPLSQALKHGQQTHGLVLKFRRLDGTVGTVMVSVVPILDHTGLTCGAVASVEDITELLKNQSLAEEARRMSRFLAMVSHELRHPLTPMTHAVSVLEKVPTRSPMAQRAHASLSRQVKQLSKLVDDLLDIARITQGKIALRHSVFDWTSSLRWTLEDYAATFHQAHLTLEAQFPERPVFLEGDPHRLTQVVKNLLQNAFRFTPRGGKVSVTLTADATRKTAQLVISDSGRGIPPHLLDAVFQPFRQLHSEEDVAQGGLGVGLSLVRALVQLHGGSVKAFSEGVNLGASFVVEIPLSAKPFEAVEINSPGVLSPRRRVLLIEHRADVAESIKDVLELEGHEVHWAADGAQGLALAEQKCPDVVLCDIGLPDMNGYEVARALRSRTSFTHVKLVALSGHSATQAAKEAGFSEQLLKPSSMDELLRVVSTEAVNEAPRG